MTSDIDQYKTIRFNNGIVNKRQLKDLMSCAFHNYGVVKSSIIADKVKNLTFHYATKSGISLSIEDLRVPQKKKSLIGLTNDEVQTTQQNYNIGNITTVERFQKVIDIWNNASNFLKEEVVTYFRESDPFNSLYIMAFSGARGNISQVRQLVGMRGLMADPQGQIIDLPIQSNFREGLTVTEYIISSYGARKGLVDTALRTADSGYLTRRLVDVAQDIIIREEDCQTREGLHKNELLNQLTPNLSLNDRIIGRLLASPIKRFSNNEILPINTILTNTLLDELDSSDLEQIKVRSPLTCNSIRSVCRNCYGWHLAYSKLVDLGEAIGIIAAQSIGEPGTQLTMRTFHTGGVFSGDLTRQIRAPFQGTLFYKTSSHASLTRTLHGERSFLIQENTLLYLENLKSGCITIKIPAGATLLCNSKQKVYSNQIIAEIKKDANLVLEEDSKTVYTDEAGEIFFQGIELQETFDKQENLVRKNKNSGLIWVLGGKRYSLPYSSELIARLGQVATSGSIFAQKQVLNEYSGVVKIQDSFKKLNVGILSFSLILQQAKILISDQNLLCLENKKKFHLKVRHNEILQQNHRIAVLDDDSYTTQTGGIVAYNLEKKFATRKRKGAGKFFSGSLYWIAEETYNIKGTVSLEKFKAKHGTFIGKGTEILPKKFTQISGILITNTSAQEIVIKPGELIKINTKKFTSIDRINGFIEPGTKIFGNTIAQKLVYVEFLEINTFDYILIRPVKTYTVPREKEFFLDHNFFPYANKQNIKIKTVKQIFFKNWEQIKSFEPVELLKTSLILDVNNNHKNRRKLQPRFEVLQESDKVHKLQISLYEWIKIDHLISNYEDQNIKTSVKLMVSENQYVNKGSALAHLELFFPTNGTIGAIKNRNASATEILVLQDKDIRFFPHHSTVQKLTGKIGDLVRAGEQIGLETYSEYSGQIYKISETDVYIRIGRPYLISEGAILEVEAGDLVQSQDKLTTLIYDKLKTVDIVQGLPKVEEILEARKIKNPCLLSPHEGYANFRNSKIEIRNEKGYITSINVDPRTKVRFSNGNFIKLIDPITDGPISPHNKLETLFNYYYYLEKYPINKACRHSFRKLQLFLVNEVQRTYLSQGVQIADKHIEIIIKQMTSKVRIEDSGDTTLLPGELLNFYQAELITKANLKAKEQTPLYSPVLLGITKASLNSDSFISAASFQETTRVLTEAAIEGKKDWLHGLKENVIIGRLIPAGTGFKHYKALKSQDKTVNPIINTQVAGIKETVLRTRFNQLLEE